MLATPPYGEQIERIALPLDLPPLQLGLMTLRGIPLSLAAERLAEQFRKFLVLARG
jgi:hypothetical protein